MSNRKSREDAEMPVKSYELEATQKQVDGHERLLSRIDDRLANILDVIQNKPTMAQVDDKIEAAKLSIQDELKSTIEKQDLKYGPIVASNKWLLGLLLTSGIGLVGTLIFIAVGLTK